MLADSPIVISHMPVSGQVGGWPTTHPQSVVGFPEVLFFLDGVPSIHAMPCYRQLMLNFRIVRHSGAMDQRVRNGYIGCPSKGWRAPRRSDGRMSLLSRH